MSTTETTTTETSTTSTGTTSTGTASGTGAVDATHGPATNDARRPIEAAGTGDGAATNDARRPARRRRLAAVLLAALVAAGAGVAVAGPSGTSPTAAGPTTETGAAVPGVPGSGGEGEGEGVDGTVAGDPGDEADGAPSTGAGRGALPRGDESGDEGDEEGEESGGGGAPAPEPQPQPEPEPDVEPEPEPQPQPEPQPEPEPEPPVAPAELAVPSELKLKPGVYTGSFTVANVGGAPLDWKAWPDPGVTVDVEEGTLAGGEEVVVTFTVDKSGLKAGSFQRRIMVDAPDVGAKDLWITGSKPIDTIVCC